MCSCNTAVLVAAILTNALVVVV